MKPRWINHLAYMLALALDRDPFMACDALATRLFVLYDAGNTVQAYMLAYSMGDAVLLTFDEIISKYAVLQGVVA